MASALGFEPRFSGSKPDVLPLDETETGGSTKNRTSVKRLKASCFTTKLWIRTHGKIRTCDLTVRSRLLYLLSYAGDLA